MDCDPAPYRPKLYNHSSGLMLPRSSQLAQSATEWKFQLHREESPTDTKLGTSEATSKHVGWMDAWVMDAWMVHALVQTHQDNIPGQFVFSNFF